MFINIIMMICTIFVLSINGYSWGTFGEEDDYSTFNGNDYDTVDQSGGHNPNQLKGIGAASASAWSTPSKPEGSQQQQLPGPGSSGGALSDGSLPNNGGCPLPHRHRKPWQLLNDEDKKLFISGFQSIRKLGKLDVITQTHANNDIENYVDDTSLFSFYYSYLVWEVETAIRDLGDEYSCVTMPYYDWTLDSGLEDDPVILKSGLGGDGDKLNGFCIVNDESFPSSWDKDSYWSQANCNENIEESPFCCLKRAKSSS
eukprot:324459_1